MEFFNWLLETYGVSFESWMKDENFYLCFKDEVDRALTICDVGFAGACDSVRESLEDIYCREQDGHIPAQAGVRGI